MTMKNFPYLFSFFALLLLFSWPRPSAHGAPGGVDNTLYASSIFKWYSGDFNDDIVGFFTKYAQSGLRDGLKKHARKIEVEYLDYDWTLNGQ